jgi:hypothetical protein
VLYGDGDDFVRRKITLTSATGAKAFAAQDGPSARRLKGNRVGFSALIADDLITLALTAARATTSAASAAEIGAARITTLLASFRLAQVPFLIIFLFSFGKGKSVSAFSAGDFDVRHDRFLRGKAKRGRLCSLVLTEAIEVLPCSTGFISQP